MRRNRRQGLTKVAFQGMVLGLGVCSHAHAQFGVQLGVGAESHSNVDLSSEDERSDIARVVSAGISYELKDNGTASADVAYQVAYEDYLHDVEEDRATIDGVALLKWHAVPNRLDFNLTQQTSDSLANRREADTADNQDRRSVTAVSADGYLHFSPVDTVVITPQFSDVRFKDNDQSDSQREELAVRWDRRLEKVSTLSLAGNYSHVTFDTSEDDYDQQSLMLTYATQLSRLSYRVGVGGNKIERDSGDDFSGGQYQAAASYQDESNQRFSAAYLHQLTDSSIGLSGAELSFQDFHSNDSNFDEVDIIEVDQIDLSWYRPFSASHSVTAAAGYMKRDYKDTARDETIDYVSAGYTYTLNTRWSFNVSGKYEYTKLTDEPKTDYKTKSFMVGANYTAGRDVTMRFSIGREDRDADQAIDSYEDNMAIIQLNYRLL